MKEALEHRARVFSSPWKGIYCTHIESGPLGGHAHVVRASLQ
jgi:hypothetical protein